MSLVSHRVQKLGRICFGLTLVGLCWCSVASAQNEKRLIRVKDKQGRETSLLEKVVVVSGRATLGRTPDAAGEPIEPWAIFFRIKNDDGSTTPQNGRLRVGDASGNPVGWIGQKDVRVWNTRFILDPIDPQRDRAFEVNLAGGGTAKQNATAEGKRRYALIVNPPAAEKGDDTEYPLIVYAGSVQGLGEGGTLSRQRNELRDVKLEIMFVIESSDFMFAVLNKEEDKALLDYVKASIRDLIATLRSDEDIRKAVRLGFAEYKDTVPKASFTSRLTCDLTDNFDKFSASLDQMQASKLQDDVPDDVLSGLNEAVKNASWSANSVKHIVLLGMTSCQLNAQGMNPPQSGANSELEKLYSAKLSKGYNSTGMSISQLVARARPQGGADSRARTSKMFHALHFGRDIYQAVPAEDREELRTSVSKITETVNRMSLSQLAEIADDPKLFEIVLLIYNLQVITHHRKLALGQYQEISRNNGEAEGIFLAVEPGAEHVQRAAASLAAKIRETFRILEKVRDGQGLPSTGAGANEISQPLFTLVGAAAEKFKDSPVLEGTATVRDRRGREVAFKKVMVSQQELQRLRSTLDALLTKFKAKTSKADRQDVGGILNTMKEALAATSAGQEVTANAKLKDLISDLPLRTAALETSAADLALMTAEAFKDWLDKVESARFRIDDLLSSRQDWLELSDRAVNDKFTFLRLSELP
jgi:hypothetical protein